MSPTPILERIPLLVNISRFASKKVKHLVKFSNVCKAWEETILEYGSPFQNLKTMMRYEKTQTKIARKKCRVGVGYTDEDEYRQSKSQDEEDEALTFFQVLFRAVKHCHSERWGSFVLNYLFSEENTVKQLVTDGDRPVMKRGFRIPTILRFPQMEFVNLQKSSFRFPVAVHRHIILFEAQDLLRMRYGHKQENLLAIVTYNKDPQMFELLMQKLREHSHNANAKTDDADNHDHHPLHRFKKEDRSLFEQLLFKAASVFNHEYLHLLGTAVRNNHIPTIKRWINDMIAPIDFDMPLTDDNVPKSLIFVGILHAINEAIRLHRREALEIILSCPNEEVKKFMHEFCFISRTFLSLECFTVNCPNDRVARHFPAKSFLRLLDIDLMEVFASRVPHFFSDSIFKPLVWEPRHGKKRRDAIGDVVFSRMLTQEQKMEIISTIATEFVLPALRKDISFDGNLDKTCQVLFSIFFGTNKTTYGLPIRLCAMKNLPDLLKFFITSEEDTKKSLHRLLFSKTELESTKLKAHRKYIMNAISFCSLTPLMICVAHNSVGSLQLLLSDPEISSLVDINPPWTPHELVGTRGTGRFVSYTFKHENILMVALSRTYISETHKKVFQLLKNHLVKSQNNEKRETALMMMKQRTERRHPNMFFECCAHINFPALAEILNLGGEENDLVADLILAKDDLGFSTLAALVKAENLFRFEFVNNSVTVIRWILDRLEQLRGKEVVKTFINAQDTQCGSTALHLMCKNYLFAICCCDEMLTIIKMLISRGADVNLKMKVTNVGTKTTHEYKPISFAEDYYMTLCDHDDVNRKEQHRNRMEKDLKILETAFDEAAALCQ